jgi:2-polyprenyl-3-methyl-5-hydroxy-6-metoxy-1,4-benzoquinol methylase/predicted SAM-dependent methyltransferase
MINSGALFVDSENEYDTYQLIDRADLCITINSQAGLEALLKGKELVLCGTAFYGGLGFTHKADDAATLAVCIDRALDAGLARNTSDAARRFFHVYLNHTCCEKTPHAIAELLAGGSRTATRESAVDAPRDDGYASGERQTALHYTEIRRDHQVRYEFAAEAIASVSGGARLSGIDAFCGNGYGTWWLAERTGASLVGIDACGEAIAVAEARYSNANTSFQELRFPFELPAARFDFVTCFESIEHVEDGARLLAELANALKPGGLLFLSTPNEAALPFRENADFFGFHFQHYAREELLDLAGSVGLAPRVELGQDVYRMQRRRACGTLEPRDMELREGAESPQFLLHVFERLTDVVAPEVTGARLDLRDVGDLDLTLAAESLDEVAVASLFERLTFVEGRHALAAWHRALVPGGRLELRVPDLRYHVDRYLEASAATTGRSRGNPRKDALAGLWGWQRSHGEVHESGYDFSMLRGLLSEHSFVDVVRLSAEPHELRVVCWKPMQSG